ncbi:MAG: hypothetical protein ABW063_13180, partial [Caulobacter sp.]
MKHGLWPKGAGELSVQLRRRRAPPQVTLAQRRAAFPQQDLFSWLDAPPPRGRVRLRWRRKPTRADAKLAATAAVFFVVGLALALAAPAKAASLQLTFPDLKSGGQVAWAVHGDADAWARR